VVLPTEREGRSERKPKRLRYHITEETFESIASYWVDSVYPLRWDCLFVLPGWLKTWWEVFGEGSGLFLHSVKTEDDIVGIAPLRVNGETASFIGSPDVCDFQDFILVPGKEEAFFAALLDHVSNEGLSRLDLGSLRPDSAVVSHLTGIARDKGFRVSCTPDDISLEMDLPPTWEGYLQSLKGKHRHETRRKLRRLHEAGDVHYRVIEDVDKVPQVIGTFLELFRESRKDKTDFMTSGMTSFFKALALTTAEINILKLCFLELDAQPAAAIMGFDFNDTLYLYNNGYDPRFQSLSVGVLSKVFSIRDSIQRGKKRFDFLKGAETYKYRMGGREVQLSRCRIDLG
jgi:CelD/BcsL family acetyltransferase involved in cellulose biosynthesis